MSQDHHEPNRGTQLIASALLSLILAIAIGGAVSSLKNARDGLAAGAIAFIIIWALIFARAKELSDQDNTRR